MKSIVVLVGCVLASVPVFGQTGAFRQLGSASELQRSVGTGFETQQPLQAGPSTQQRLGIVSDWSSRHALYPASNNLSLVTRIQRDPRWTQEWYLHHRQIWWPGRGIERLNRVTNVHRDWSETLGFTGPAYQISSITQTGNTVTVTTASGAPVAGQMVLISGVSPGTGGCSVTDVDAINGEQTITVTSTTTFTFTSSVSATIVSTDCTLTMSSIAMGPTPFEPLFDYAFTNSGQTGYASMNTFDEFAENAGYLGYLATAGTLTVTAGVDTGTYPLYRGGPASMSDPYDYLTYDNLLFPDYPTTSPTFDGNGLLFAGSGLELKIFSFSGNGEDYDWVYEDGVGREDTFGPAGPFRANSDPGGGQTFPAKYVFNVDATPSCTGDYVVMGIPSAASAGAQADIVGYNQLYTGSGSGNLCSGTNPSVIFAYATANGGEVPGSVSISLTGKKLAFVEDLFPTSANPNGSSYFHVLTIGNGADEGTNPTTGSVTPGSGSSNATDDTVLLQTGGANQSSTTSPFIDYTNDAAYVTTYAWSGAGTGSGYLYKISPVFGTGTPAIVWSVAISGAVPSSPVFDVNTSKVFFTDSGGNIDFVTDNGSSASGITSLSVASGTTSENPVTLDTTNGYVYATFNTNGTNAIVAQAPESLATFVAAPVGTGNTLFTGPYDVDFNNAWYTGSGTPELYVAGTGTGTVPTLYQVGFTSGVMDTTTSNSGALATGGNGIADASPVTEFYNANTGVDYLFAGVTNNCYATTYGGSAGCVMSLDITNGFPTIATTSTAISATGGSTGLIIDNDSTGGQASSVYYGTKNGGALVKATQAGLE